MFSLCTMSFYDPVIYLFIYELICIILLNNHLDYNEETFDEFERRYIRSDLS